MPRKGNDMAATAVYSFVKMRIVWAVPIAAAVCVAAVSGDYLSAKKKLDVIEGEKLQAGSRVQWTAGELNAWIAHELPAGVRNARVQVLSPGVARGTALVDFAKVRRAQGYEPGWLLSKLLDGERPVSVTARIRSGAGQATVDVDRVEISSLLIDGRTLDFLIQNFVLPMYPDAVVGRPFELRHRIAQIDVQPAAVAVVIGK
jgi:hypothetical protein